MSDFLPIEIRHLDQTVQPLLSSNLFPVVIGDENNGFETRATTIKEVFEYVNLENQDSFINTLNINNSAIIQNFLNVGQIYEDTGYKLYVDGDVLIGGALSALSGVTFFNTDIITTSSLYLTGGDGVVLKVEQPFNFPIAQFYDGDSTTGNISLHIDGENIRAGNVGVKTVTPNEALTVFGNISSSGTIYSLNSIIDTFSSNNLETNSINVKDSLYLGTNDYSLMNLGNSSSNIDINGNVTINTIYSGVSTVIGNTESEVFINGYLFTKDISASGNIYINSDESEAFNISIGNPNSTNVILGTNLISAESFIDGETNINSVESYNTYINTGENTGVVYLGNNQNKTEINSNIFSVNSVLTSDFIYLNFTDYDSLTATIEDIFATTTVVASSLIENTLNPELTSFQYKILQNVEAQNINLTEEIVNLGNTDFLVNIKGSTINLNPDSVINISTLSGGNINLGGEQTSTKIEGVIVQINNENDGITKNTFINNEEFSGNLYLGNVENDSYLDGIGVYINTNENSLTANNTFIGNSSAITTIKNLNIVEGLTANVPEFIVSNVFAGNIVTDTLLVNQNATFDTNVYMVCGLYLPTHTFLPNLITFGSDLNLNDYRITSNSLFTNSISSTNTIFTNNLNISGSFNLNGDLSLRSGQRLILTPTNSVRSVLNIGNSSGDPANPIIGDIWLNQTNLNFRTLTSGTLTLVARQISNVFTSPQSINASNNTVPMLDITQTGNAGGLRITNTGTGNCLLINDQSGDTSPFVVKDDGKVGIGTSLPNKNLTVVGDISAINGTIYVNEETQISEDSIRCKTIYVDNDTEITQNSINWAGNKLFDLEEQKIFEAGGADVATWYQEGFYINGAATRNLSFELINYTGQKLSTGAYIIVKPSSSAITNGTELLNAYASAKTFTPNTSALSINNRATVMLLPGTYDLGTTRLNLDTDFVDIIGITDTPEQVVITSQVSISNSGTIYQTANDVKIKGVTINRTGTPQGTGSSRTAAYFPFSNNINITYWIHDQGDLAPTHTSYVQTQTPHGLNVGDSIRITGAVSGNSALNGAFTVSEVVSPETIGFLNPNPAGTIALYDGPVSNVILQKRLNRTYIENCVFSVTSDSAMRIGTDYAGIYRKCISGNHSFGGTFGGNPASTAFASGTFEDCVAGSESFGGIGTASGVFTRCTATTSSFGGFASGTFTDCSASNGFTTAIGVFTRCSVSSSGFGSGFGGSTNGTLIDCTITSNAYNGTFTGTARRCRFVATNANAVPLRVGAGAKIFDSTLIATGTGNSITADSAVTISLAGCRMNKSINANVSNNLGTLTESYNLIDEDID
jgi:hypothetical protein